MTTAYSENSLTVHLRVVGALLRREMTTRYGRSAGGYFWAIAEPVSMIALLCLVFSAIARTPPLGGSFVLFFATGSIAFNFYRTTSSVLAGAIKSNVQLLRYPNVAFIDTLVARGVLQFLTSCVVSAIVLAGAVHISGEPARLDPVRIAGAVAAAVTLAAGVGAVNAVLFPLYPTWERVFGILNGPLFLVSGVFFLPDTMPPAIQELLAYNPLVHAVSVFREGMFPSYSARLDSLEYPVALGLALLLTGLLLLRRHRERLGDT